MRAQVTLTPTESKKLLSKAIAAMEPIQKAKENGLIVIHPSSTTIFLIEELIGKRPEGPWVFGVTVPKGMCISRELQQRSYLLPGDPGKGQDVGKFPFSWVLEKGIFKTMLTLDSLLDRMGKEDIYVKGAIAIDAQRKAGVVYLSLAAGTIGKVISASKRKGFSILIPIGLEKLIPTPIHEAAKAASRDKTDSAMGIPIGLIPVPGEVVTELEAIAILSGAEALAVAAGGLGGAEGSVTLVIQGKEGSVERALQVVRSVKGAALPKIRPTDCSSCCYPSCHLKST